MNKIEIIENQRNQFILKMLELNQIDSIIDGKVEGSYYTFNTDDITCFKKYIESSIDERSFHTLMKALRQGLMDLELFMIDKSFLKLEVDSIFFDHNNKVKFIPSFEDKEYSLVDLYNEIIINFNFDLNENTSYAFKYRNNIINNTFLIDIIDTNEESIEDIKNNRKNNKNVFDIGYVVKNFFNKKSKNTEDKVMIEEKNLDKYLNLFK